MFATAFAFAIKLLPLYGNILLGYCAGRWARLDQETIARFMFYLVSPIIVFHVAWHASIDFALLSLPIIAFAIASALGVLFYCAGRYFWASDLRNIAAFSAGSGATGFFGIPLALTLLGPELEGRYIMAALGVTLYDNSVGYYISMRATQTASSCLQQVLRLPSIYAFFAGLLFNGLGVPDHGIYHEFIQPIRGVYFVLGLMLVGLCLSELPSFRIHLRLTLVTFFAKFVVWPLVAGCLVLIDQRCLHFYSACDHSILLLLSVVPIAINTVVMASLNRCHPDLVAVTVVLSAGFALVYLPIVATLFFPCAP